MNTEDRIKLAEAMGWKWDTTPNQFAPGLGRWWFGGMCKDWSEKDQISAYFDPENDANHDYAVLEWIRNHENEPMFTAFREELRATRSMEFGAAQNSWSYRIGNNARAALKVLP